MPLQVWTARLPRPKYGIKGYTGRDAFNVTRRGGGPAADPFAPSEALLEAALRMKQAAGRNKEKRAEAWRWYEQRFVEEMRQSYKQHAPTWQRLLAQSEVTLTCYCGKPEECHRGPLAGILVKLGAVYNGERPEEGTR